MSIKPVINRCCSPVLPSVYGEALSYEEQICKLTAKMNEIIDFANNELSDKLKAYIDQRFNSMMINAIYEPETETITLKLEEGN